MAKPKKTRVKKIRCFNVNNFLIAKLMKTAESLRFAGVYNQFHMTDKFTEVTDGHSLMRVDAVEIESSNDILNYKINELKLKPRKRFDFTIEVKNALEIYEMMKKKDGAKLVWLSEGEMASVAALQPAVFEFPDKRIVLDQMEVKYVKTTGLFPKPDSKLSTVSFAPGLMSRVIQLFAQAEVPGVRMHITGEKEAIQIYGTIRFPAQTFSALVMPMLLPEDQDGS